MLTNHLNQFSMNYRKELESQSWTLIKNYFDDDFCDQLRKDCYAASQTNNDYSDILSNQHLSHLLTNEKFIELVCHFFDAKPVYFGDSGYQIASVVKRISNGFHKDSIDRKNPDGMDWKHGYSLIRFGIYLQDHENFSEGLVVRSNSHHTPDLKTGKKVNVPSKKGDIIAWYLTTTHSGNAKRIKGIDYPVLMGDETGGWLSHKLYYHLPKFCIQKSEKDRVAIFITFGTNDVHLKRYLSYLKHRRYMVELWQKQDFIKETVNKINAQNKIELLDLKEEALKFDMQNFKEYDFANYKNFNI